MRIPSHSQASLSSMLTQEPCTRYICPHIKMAERSAVMTLDATNIKDLKKCAYGPRLLQCLEILVAKDVQKM